MHGGWTIPFWNLFMFLTGILLVLYFMRPWDWRSIGRYDTSSYIIFFCAVNVQAVCLCILLMIRVAVIVTLAMDKSSGVVTKPFDFFAMTNECSKIPIYGLVSGFSVRCGVSSVLLIFARLTAS